MSKKYFVAALLLAACVLAGGSGEAAGGPFPLAPERILQSMTLEQKVGQLFVIRPDQLDTALTPEEIHDSKKQGSRALTDTMRKTLRRYPAGGYILFEKNIASPGQLRKFTEALQGASFIPPVMAIDEEGGKISRIANAKGFDVPRFESTEAIGRKRQARQAAAAIGKYLREYGFNLDLAPVADVNTNPENIVIGSRAFGSRPALVSKMVGAYLDGLHEQGIVGSIKHFPGHGDTKGDTHDGGVAVDKTWSELSEAELIPFRENFDKADSVMVAHITLPNVTKDGLPASLSKELITGKLREELGYEGVVITDALSMKAISNHYSSAETAVLAFEAGNDILLMPWDYREAFEGVLQAVREGRISEARLNESVLRILRMRTLEPSSPH